MLHVCYWLKFSDACCTVNGISAQKSETESKDKITSFYLMREKGAVTVIIDMLMVEFDHTEH